MDGVTKELAEYFEKLERLGDVAIEAIKEQIDIESDRTEKEIRDNTPQGETGGLLRALTRTKIDNGKKYGYRIEYAGENEKGEPYEKIANILNSGSSTIKPRRFIARAVKKLKGMDDRAVKRFKEKAMEDHIANVVSLCSHCHNFLHYGRLEDKKADIEKLYNERKNKLAEAGISIEIEVLLEIYK